METSKTLERIAGLLRREIGPAIDAEYTKTQAFMASVILQKLAKQLALAADHHAATQRDFQQLVEQLQRFGQNEILPANVQDALSIFVEQRSNGALSALIQALYQAQTSLGQTLFQGMLDAVRKTLRREIDRRMEYAE